MLDRIIGAIGGGSKKQERADRLGIVVLSERAVHFSATKTSISSEMCCSMRQLQEYVAPHTPIDLLLFYGLSNSWDANDGAADDAELKRNIDLWTKGYSPCQSKPIHPNMGTHFLPIHPDHWRAGAWATKGHPHYRMASVSHYGTGYQLMGQWRLLHQFRLMRSLGYRYALQFDHDSHIMSPVDTDLVKLMLSRNIYMGARIIKEEPSPVS